MADKDLLSEYINKILSLQEEQRQLTLSDASLRQIAAEMGIDERGWQLLQQTFENHRTRAQGFMRYRNWDKSIHEYEQALPIRPFDEPTLQGLAQSHYNRWQQEQAYSDKRMATVYAEKCLQTNPRNDFSLRIITELGTVEAPQADEVILPEKNKAGKLTMLILIGAVFITMGMLLLFVTVGADGGSSQLPVELQASDRQLAVGEREIPVSFVGNSTVGGLQLLLQEARFREYSKSSSFTFKGYLKGKGVEITQLKLRMELLDKQDKRLYEDKIEVIGKFDEPVRSLDLMPITYLKHIRNKKGLYPHGARLSVLKMEWREIPTVYEESPVKNVLLEGSASGLDIVVRERSSQYNEHPKERYVFHKLQLEITNKSGQVLRQVKARIKWFDADGKTIEQQNFTLLEKDAPQLLLGQTLPVTISEKLAKAGGASDIQGYQITIYEAE